MPDDDAVTMRFDVLGATMPDLRSVSGRSQSEPPDHGVELPNSPEILDEPFGNARDWRTLEQPMDG